MTGRANQGFQEALAEAERDAATASKDPAHPRRPEATVCIDLNAIEGAGAALWAFAMEWTDEPAQPIARQASSPTFETASLERDLASIARELGLGAALTLTQLASRRRAFIWCNHPDRQPAHARARAGERVALANALYDAARRKLAGSR